MIDKKFYKKYAQDIVNRYRKLIFDPAGGGAGAQDVYGQDYPPFSNYSEGYRKAKAGKSLPRRSEKFSNSNAPVLTEDLMKDFQGHELLSDGFKFGTVTRGAVVKNLDKLKRTISSNRQPIPKKLEDYIMDLADEYSLKLLRKQQKGRTFDIKD